MGGGGHRAGWLMTATGAEVGGFRAAWMSEKDVQRKEGVGRGVRARARASKQPVIGLL